MNNTENIATFYGNRLRVRVCGILIEEDNILLIKHKSITKSGVFWAPPGGGLEFGESIENALKREFLEETGLEIEVIKFLFVNEFLKLPLHGIELFFEVKRIGGTLKKGFDPEMDNQIQIIIDTQFIALEKLSKFWHSDDYHTILKNINSNIKVFFSNGE